MISLTRFANFNSAIPWGLWVGVYIWFIGISAGSFLLVCCGNLMNNPQLKKITLPALILGISALSAGLLSIMIDLGHIERFYKLFFSPSPSSVMAWMVWLYGVYFGLLGVSVLILKNKKEIPKIFLLFSILFSLGLLIAESLLFALPPGKHWHSPIFVAHFLTSSFVSGAAALIIIAGFMSKGEEKAKLFKTICKITLPLVIINFVVEIIEMVYPSSLNHIENWISLAVNLILITMLSKNRADNIRRAGFIALLGMLLSKYNSLVSAQRVEPFKGFGASYIEPRLGFNYSPSGFEILAALCLIFLALAVFYIIYKVLPFTREE